MIIGKRQISLAVGIGLLLGVAGILAIKNQGKEFEVVSAAPNVEVEWIDLTAGTNHTYFYGGFIDRLIDPFLQYRGVTQANRVQYTQSDTTVVMWVMFKSPEFR